MNRRSQQPADFTRTGSMVPAIGMMLLVMGAALALVLDRLWLDSAQIELRTAAEAAVLAAGHELLDDGLLVSRTSKEQLLFEGFVQERARQAAAAIASQNLVAGSQLLLNTAPDGDIRFGKLVQNELNGLPVFLETTSAPNSIAIEASRLRRHGNPVAVLFRELAGTGVADAAELAEATIDDRPVGLRPLDDQPVPVLPIAILAEDALEVIDQTWNTMIEQNAGTDAYRFDETSGRIIKDADQIPELTLDANFHPGDDDEKKLFNVVLLDFNSRLEEKTLDRQIRSGLTAVDLKSFGGDLNFSNGSIRMYGETKLPESLLKSLASVIGQQRIVFLFSQAAPVSTDSSEQRPIDAIKPVCVRVMAIRIEGTGELQLVVQPTIMSTRTALMHASPVWSEDGDRFQNRYLKKLHLSQ